MREPNAASAGLFPLQPQKIEPRGRGIVDPPRLDWLALKLLRVDSSFQRPISKHGRKTIDKIVGEFSWSRFAPVIVSPCDGFYSIIDGQHRATAAMECGIKSVPCQIIIVPPAEQAAAFAAINGCVTPTTIFHVYKASLAGGEPWAVELFKTAKRAGVEVLFYPVQATRQAKPGLTMAIGALRRTIQMHGPELVTTALKAIVASQQIGSVTNKAVFIMARVLGRNSAWASDPEQLVNAMRKFDWFSRVDSNGLQMAIEETLERRLGKSAMAPADLDGQVLELRRRKFSVQQIAAKLCQPYGVISLSVQRVRGGN